MCIVLSCDSATYDEVAKIDTSTGPTYSANISAIVKNNCLGCHGGADYIFPQLDTFDQVKQSIEEGLFICRIEDSGCGDVMPPTGKMSVATISTIKKWIDTASYSDERKAKLLEK